MVKPKRRSLKAIAHAMIIESRSFSDLNIEIPILETIMFRRRVIIKIGTKFNPSKSVPDKKIRNNPKLTITAGSIEINRINSIDHF